MKPLFRGMKIHKKQKNPEKRLSCSKFLGTSRFCMTFVDWDGCSWKRTSRMPGEPRSSMLDKTLAAWRVVLPWDGRCAMVGDG